MLKVEFVKVETVTPEYYNVEVNSDDCGSLFNKPEGWRYYLPECASPWSTDSFDVSMLQQIIDKLKELNTL